MKTTVILAPEIVFSALTAGRVRAIVTGVRVDAQGRLAFDIEGDDLPESPRCVAQYSVADTVGGGRAVLFDGLTPTT